MFEGECSQIAMVHFIKKLSETCFYSIKACYYVNVNETCLYSRHAMYVNYSKLPPLMSFSIETPIKEVIQIDRVSRLHNVPKRVLGRSIYLHTDMKAHGSYSDPDGGESYNYSSS